ncbi:MAG: CDP-glucose 4,6-dehydratase [Roseburia sp.]|nr:CDP-glucose 4,6-dehydratase [Roseburia sp.]
MLDSGFYFGKKVLVTGHTGFKGSWLCKMLVMFGAKLTGYALEPPTNPSLFRLCGLENQMNSVLGDIRDLEHMKKIFVQEQPEIVIHMAAQPIVRESYKNPVETYETNVMGTVNTLECIRQSSSVKAFVNVTTDKVYRNREWEWGYRENEELNGFDPYSNSKSCSELVTECYINSFLREQGVTVSTVRAGNVIGGGDFAPDRIIPDCIRAAEAKKNIIVRNPHSIRPYQHVLEPISVYLMVAKEQYENPDVAGNYNVGPEEKDCLLTGDLVTLFCKQWKEVVGEDIAWENRYDGGPHEANFLKLDCSKLKRTFGWKSKWDIRTAVEKTVEFSAACLRGEDVEECIERQVNLFLKDGI